MKILDGLEPLGWIHTQPNETSAMTASDVTCHAKFVASPDGGWNPSDAVCIAVSYTPGSCSLTAYNVTAEGILFGKNNKDMSPSPEGFSPSFSKRAQLLYPTEYMVFLWYRQQTKEHGITTSTALNIVPRWITPSSLACR